MGSNDESGFQFCRPPERFSPAQAIQVPLVAGGEGSIFAAGWVFVAVLVLGLGSFFVSLVTEPSEMSFANIEETRAAVEESRLPPFPYAENDLVNNVENQPSLEIAPGDDRRGLAAEVGLQPAAGQAIRRAVIRGKEEVARVRAEYEANIARLMKTMIGAGPGVCRGCGADIYWVTTKAGKKAPFTAAALSHFADCPAAERFRKRKRS